MSIGFVIDDSGSMTNKRDRVAAAALALVEASHPDDEAFVIHFNEKAYLDLDFTHDRKRLAEGLGKFDYARNHRYAGSGAAGRRTPGA